MGVAQSKNVAEAISEVTNDISSSVNVSATYISNATQSINIDCYIGGNLDVNAVTKNVAQAKQLSKLTSDTAITNSIQQKMLQAAISTVGFLSVGYADASNAASMMSSVSNRVSSTINNSIAQVSLSQQEFTCGAGGHVVGNVSINFGAGNEFLGSQDAALTQINNITNTVTQDISQKASATTEGFSLAGLLIILMIIAVALACKPKGTGAVGENRGGWVAFGSIFLLFGAAGTLLYGFIAQVPPFFDDPPYKSPNKDSPVGNCESGLVDEAIRTIYLKRAPLRYSYDILERGTNGSLLELAIVKLAGSVDGHNGGMNGNNYRNEGVVGNLTMWNKDIYARPNGIPQLPNILKLYYVKNTLTGANTATIASIPDQYILPVTGEISDNTSCVPGSFTCGLSFDCGKANSGVDCNGSVVYVDSSVPEDRYQLAVPNIVEWELYIKPNGLIDRGRANHARFVLCNVLGIPTDVYAEDDEEVQFTDKNGVEQRGPGQSFNGQALRMSGFKIWDRVSALDSSASLTGILSVCNTNQYKVLKAFNTWAIWTVLGIFILMLLVHLIREFVTIRKARRNKKINTNPPP